MTSSSAMDDFLKVRLDRADKWMEEGRIPYSSKVIPVSASLESRPWILPTEQVLEYLRNARSFAVADCACRTHYKRCDSPLEICFFLNDASDKLVAKGSARRLSIEDAKARLALANTHGLVHLTLNNPDQYPFAICSCCSCCCHDLQFLLKYGRKDLVARSEYIAVQDGEACIDCGLCVERCVFGARVLGKDGLEYDRDQCYGCGLCVTVCPSEAIVMDRKG